MPRDPDREPELHDPEAHRLGEPMVGYIAHEHYGIRRVACRDVDGEAVLQGDIRLGPSEAMRRFHTMALDAGLGDVSGLRMSDMPREISGVLAMSHRWTDRTVHYTFYANTPPCDQHNIKAAIAWWSASGFFHFEEIKQGTKKRDYPPDYVVFRTGSGGAKGFSSLLGRRGKKQTIDVMSTDSLGKVAHEIGHALGLVHEHMRRDALSYVDIRWANLEDTTQLDQYVTDVEGLRVGAYDYASLMHYQRTGAEAKDGPDGTKLPLLVAREPNVDDDGVLGQRDAIAITDLDTAMAVYAESISRVEVEIETGGAESMSSVYLGLGGREFRLDRASAFGDNFLANTKQSFVLGAGAGDRAVTRPEANDPRTPPLSLAYVLAQPAYLRLQTGGAPWTLKDAKVTLEVHEVHKADHPKIVDLVYDLGGRGGMTLCPDLGWTAHLERRPPEDYRRLSEPEGASPPIYVSPRERTISGIECSLHVRKLEAPGQVFLGLAGREFRLAPATGDYLQGQVATLILGEGANVQSEGRNDPRTPRLTETALAKLPRYLRVEGGHDWSLGEASTVTVKLGSGSDVVLAPALAPLRMSHWSGEICHLRYAGAPRFHTYPAAVANLPLTGGSEATVGTIEVRVHTGTGSGAETFESVYLGIGGREFRIDNLDIWGDNFLRGGVVTVKLGGEGANVVDPASNDPRNPALTLLDLDTYPVYLRKPGPDGWGLARAKVTVTMQSPDGKTMYWREVAADHREPFRFPTTDAGPGNEPIVLVWTTVLDELELGSGTGSVCALARVLAEAG